MGDHVGPSHQCLWILSVWKEIIENNKPLVGLVHSVQILVWLSLAKIDPVDSAEIWYSVWGSSVWLLSCFFFVLSKCCVCLSCLVLSCLNDTDNMDLIGMQSPSSTLDLTLAHWGNVRAATHSNSVNIKKGQMGYSGQNPPYKNIKFSAASAPGREVIVWLLAAGQYSPAGSWCLDTVFLCCALPWDVSSQLKQNGQGTGFNGLIWCWPSFCVLAICHLMKCLFLAFAHFLLDSFVLVTAEFRVGPLSDI